MFKRLIKKLYFKAYPYAADIGKDEVRELSVEVRELRENIRAYERQTISRSRLNKRVFEAIEFVPCEMIPTDSSKEVFEKYLRENFAHKLAPEIIKRLEIKIDKDLSNPIMTAYKARYTFYEEEA